MIKTYAALINESNTELQEVPLCVNFWSDKSNDEVTYVRLATDQDAVRGDKGFIGSIPVRHPAGIVLDEQNWAGFLHLQLTYRDKMQKEFVGSEYIRGFRSIQSYPSFGCYCFVIEAGGNKYGIVIDRPDGSHRPLRLVNRGTIIKTPSLHYTAPGVYYDDHGLVMKKERASKNIRPHHDVYHISFTQPLNGAQILRVYLGGLDQLNLTPTMFHKAVDEWELQFYSVEGFEYFKSVDAKVLFTLQSNPVSNALGALKERMQKSSRPNSLEYPYEVLTEFYARHPVSSAGARQVLEWIVQGLEQLQE